MQNVVDLRPELLTVRDQGRRPTCLAFALSAAHEHYSRRANHLSTEHLFFNGVQRMPLRDPVRGLSMGAGSAALTEDGQVLERHWPYRAEQPPAQEWGPPTKLGRIYRANITPSSLDVASLLACLDAGTPVVLGLLITTCFMRCGADGFLPEVTPDPIRGGHAVVAVGHGQNARGQHILVRNSWGTGWGANGHAWLTTDYIHRHMREAARFSEGPT